MPNERVPPHDREAERAVLGSVLLNEDALAFARLSLGPEHFYHKGYGRMFQAMIDLHAAGTTIDPVTLGSELVRRGELQICGGAMIFSELLDSVATVANVENYAKIVREKAAVRAMIVAAQAVAVDGLQDPQSPEEYMAGARSAVISAASLLYTSKGPRLASADLVELHKDVTEGKSPTGIIKTGMAEIDETTGGLWPGLLTVCAARPGMGKSAFALNVATNAALAERRVLYITLEDVREFALLRILARFSDVDLQRLILRSIRRDEHGPLVEAMNKLHNLPLWIDDSAGLTSDNISQIAASHMNLHGLDLLVVDHLGHVADQGDKFYEVISKAARAFADLAKELDIPVLLMAQLSRAVENRTDKRPMLSDLRDSGKIEEVARFVWFLYRPAYYTDNPDVRHILKLIVAKASHGKTGTVDLWNDLSRMYIRDWDVAKDGSLHQHEEPSAPKSNRKSKRKQTDFFDGPQTGPFYDPGEY